MTDDTPTQPVTEIYPNPIVDASHSHFSHYEIQTNRAYQDSYGEQYVEPYRDIEYFEDEEACGPVLYGVYGRYNSGSVEHLFDRADLDMARDTLRSMIGGTI